MIDNLLRNLAGKKAKFVELLVRKFKEEEMATTQEKLKMASVFCVIDDACIVLYCIVLYCIVLYCIFVYKGKASI